MRIFVTGLMMFVGGLGVGLGFGWFAGKQEIRATDSENLSPQTDGAIAKSPSTREPSSMTTIEPEVLTVELNNALAVVQERDGDIELSQDLSARLAEIETRLQLLELSDTAEPATPRNRREIDQQTLLQAGFDEFEVSVVTEFFNQQQLQRLEIRDRATREGWIDSAEFRQRLRENRDQSALRLSLGEDRYDLFLLSQGRNNRVRIDEVMSGSAAQQAGVVAGDVISRYADATIYNVGDLRSATTAGERDEVVSLTIIRNSDELELSVPRGPLGVTVSGIQVE